jgi:nucleotide-binding universal stress UspA family protein
MMRILAAVNSSAAARPVLAHAAELARLVGGTVEAVHVGEDDDVPPMLGELIAGLGLHLRLAHGDVVTELCAAARVAEVGAVVVGSRSLPGGATPVGHVTHAVLENVHKPVVVVPPDAEMRPLSRVLMPLEGVEEIAPALAELCELLGAADADIVVLHVFEPEGLPPFADHSTYESDAWSEELVARSMPSCRAHPHVELRVGDATEVLRVAPRELDIGLVAVSWHRNLSPSRARVVRTLLTSSRTPIALFPTNGEPDGSLIASGAAASAPRARS